MTNSSSAVMQTLAWLRKNQFKAVALNFRSKAAIGPQYVEANYQSPPDALWQDNNYGVGVVTGGAGPVDIDLDCPEAVALASSFLPPTPAIFGRQSKPASHYLYRVATPLSKHAFLDPIESSTIIEIRADGGHQTVLPGSFHQDTGELIRWESAPFPDVPTVEPDVLVKAARFVAVATLISRHLWLDGQRNEMCKHLSGMFFYLDWSVEEAAAMIEAVMHVAGDDDRTRRPTVVNTYRKAEKGGKVTGAATLRRLIGNDVLIDRLLEWSGSPTVNLMQAYNERFAVVNVEGRFRIADTDVEPGEPPTFMQKDDFLNLQATDIVTIEDKPVPKARLWLSNSRRRAYRSVDFMPGADDSHRALNLWTGWALAPDPSARCDAWMELLHKVVCGGDDQLTTWMLHWFANIVREPRSKPLTAPVLIGRQGAGKSLLLSYFGRVLGPAYTVITNEEHIYGKFNRHLATTLLLHSEEALYGGEKKHRGIIKSLITDEFRIFEQKGIDARQVRNYLRLALTSNEAHAAPAEPNDRRFTVIDMDDRVIEGSLLKRVLNEIGENGPGALFHLLMTMDYDPAVPRTNIKNAALATLKGINLSPMESWWQEQLTSGYVLPDYLAWASQTREEPWPRVVSSTALYMAMVLRLRDRGVRPIPNETAFSFQLNKFTGKKLIRGQRQFTNPLSDDAPREVRYMSDRQNAILNLPNLTECRDAFSIYVGQPLDWPLPDEGGPPDEKY